MRSGDRRTAVSLAGFRLAALTLALLPAWASADQIAVPVTLEPGAREAAVAHASGPAGSALAAAPEEAAAEAPIGAPVGAPDEASAGAPAEASAEAFAEAAAEASAEASAEALADAASDDTQPAKPPAQAAGRLARHPADPWEGFNRRVFIINGVLDHFVIQPLAEAYEFVMPSLLREGVENFLGNIGDMWSTINLLLQGKPAAAAEMTMRVGLNTVFGLGGVFDVAREAGLERQSEDFGQTLAVWGSPAGAYLVVPIFGPSTVRDAVAMPLDRAFRQQFAPSGESQRWRWVGGQIVHARADVLPFTRMLDTVALDKYVYVRDAYLARRRSLIHDGNPPSLDDEEPRSPPASRSRTRTR